VDCGVNVGLEARLNGFIRGPIDEPFNGRCHLRQEPDAGNPLVRIRGGGHE
jgi:hypothetical protein